MQYTRKLKNAVLIIRLTYARDRTRDCFRDYVFQVTEKH